jgi:hypothetical protein
MTFQLTVRCIGESYLYFCLMWLTWSANEWIANSVSASMTTKMIPLWNQWIGWESPPNLWEEEKEEEGWQFASPDRSCWSAQAKWPEQSFFNWFVNRSMKFKYPDLNLSSISYHSSYIDNMLSRGRGSYRGFCLIFPGIAGGSIDHSTDVWIPNLN